MTGGSPPTLAARTRVARYVVALLIVVGAVAVLLMLQPRLCRDERAADATKPASVCGPPAMTDAVTVGFVSVILLLLAPDLSEAGVAGVTLKRAVEEAKADAATARADVAAVRFSVTQLRQETVATSSAHATTVVQSGEADLIQALAKIGLLRGVPPPRAQDDAGRPRAAPVSVDDTVRALLLSEHVERAKALLPEELRPGTFIGIAGELTVLAGPDLPEALIERVVTAPDGAVARARAGNYAVTAASADIPAVIAAPAWATGGVLAGVVAVVPPPDADLSADDTALHLAPAAAMFAAGVGSRLGPVAEATMPGPVPAEEAP